MREANNELTRAREGVTSATTGLPLARQELAELVNSWLYQHRGRVAELDENYIGKLERGVIRWPQDDYRAALRAVLGATDRSLGFYPPRRKPPTVADVNRNQFLRVAALGVGMAAAPDSLRSLVGSAQPTPVPSSAGRREIDEVRTIARAVAGWDAVYGGGLARQAIAAQLEYSVELLHARCAMSLRPELFAAVGYLAHTAAFSAFDAYAHDDARRWFRLALTCAEEAQEWHLRAKVLSSMARQEIWCGNWDAGLTLHDLALVRADRLTPTERAMLHTGRARALAKLGRVQETLRAVGAADEEFTGRLPTNAAVDAVLRRRATLRRHRARPVGPRSTRALRAGSAWASRHRCGEPRRRLPSIPSHQPDETCLARDGRGRSGRSSEHRHGCPGRRRHDSVAARCG
ncbi:hypothetical protein SAMN05444320_10793 [Streptoalloteichus hindustanus]|uniref:Helix-turn-helix domain-containing protein n=1 Tax=Streptoalloteichus hindustanus TaxID=2017 RepID=A0A1M5I3V7_STRHI|nr:hypothetical protein SAMN05444320_10793 [Streptoalloteichus hindustanus]